MSTGTPLTTISNLDTSAHNWVLAAGDRFGVDTNGTLYAKNTNIAGRITATAGYVGDFEINRKIFKQEESGAGNNRLIKTVSIAAGQIDVSSAYPSNSYNKMKSNLARISQKTGIAATDLGRFVYVAKNETASAILPALVGFSNDINICNNELEGDWTLNNLINNCQINAVYLKVVKPLDSNPADFDAANWRSVDFTNANEANGIAQGFTPVAAFLSPLALASHNGSIDGADSGYWYKEKNLSSIIVDTKFRKVYYLLRCPDAYAQNRKYAMIVFGHLTKVCDQVPTILMTNQIYRS